MPVELVNTQIALQGVEQKGFVLASSYVTQVRGAEHEPKVKEGDLVAKKSWIATVQDLQVCMCVCVCLCVCVYACECDV